MEKVALLYAQKAHMRIGRANENFEEDAQTYCVLSFQSGASTVYTVKLQRLEH